MVFGHTLLLGGGAEGRIAERASRDPSRGWGTRGPPAPGGNDGPEENHTIETELFPQHGNFVRSALRSEML
jgi:hypothetical protein